MNLFGLMETSGEAMQAERMRAEVVAANMANAETTRTATGGPYRRQHVVFAADRGDPAFLDSMTDASLRQPCRLYPAPPMRRRVCILRKCSKINLHRSSATILGIRMRTRTAMSLIRILIRSQRWLI